jgi:poly(A) polymerase
MAAAICRRLRFSNDDTDQICALVANHMKFKDVAQMRESTLKRFVRLPRFPEHLELHRLDCTASHGNLAAYETVKQFLAATPPEAIRPPRLITGNDLLTMGYTPGPDFQKILTAIEDGQMEGSFASKKEAIAYVERTYPQNATRR